MNVSRETFHAAMKECKRGETLQVTIETATADGTGIARVDGQVVFVPGALPGEVNCCVWSSRRRTAWSRTVPIFQDAAAARCGIWTMRRNWNSSARTSIIA